VAKSQKGVQLLMKMHTALFVAAAVSACSMTAKTQSSEPSDSQSIVANIDATYR